MAQTPDLYVRIKAGAFTKMQAVAATLEDKPKVYSQIDIDRDQLNNQYSCIVMVTAGLQEELSAEGTDTIYEAYAWPIGVMIYDRSNVKASENEPKYLTWRKVITDAFHKKKIDIPEYNGPGTDKARCFVEPKMIFDPRLPQYELVRSSLLLKFFVLEAR